MINCPICFKLNYDDKYDYVCKCSFVHIFRINRTIIKYNLFFNSDDGTHRLSCTYCSSNNRYEFHHSSYWFGGQNSTEINREEFYDIYLNLLKIYDQTIVMKILEA